ncbi:MAG: exonuclease domain-containing protein [Acidobacteriota bacterium]
MNTDQVSVSLVAEETATSFVAIDFETANRKPSSACALGIVHVREGEICERKMHLLNPGAVEFEFTSIHGLTRESVAKANSFEDLWPELKRDLEDAPFLVAHNAAFDRRVLQAIARRAHVRLPRLRFRCSMNLAEAVWGCRPADLATMALRLEIPLRHHDPVSDAEASARIFLAAHRERFKRLAAGEQG